MKCAYCIHVKDDWNSKIECALADAAENSLTFVDYKTYIASSLNSACALMTFDDGFEQRYPDIPAFLRKKKIRALTFLITMNPNMSSLIVDWNFWRRNLDVFDVGAHSLTHSKVATSHVNELEKDPRALLGRKNIGGCFKNGLVNREYDALRGRVETDAEFSQRVFCELIVPKQMIERQLGVTCDSFAYPWGDIDDLLMYRVKLTGYSSAFGLRKNTDVNSAFKLPRKPIS